MRELNFKEIGKRIRNQREQLNYTREQLAEKLDVSSKFISDIELGVKGISIKTLANLTDILNMNADYLLFGEEYDGGAEQSMIVSLYRKCPEQHRSNLITIVKSFVDTAIEK